MIIEMFKTITKRFISFLKLQRELLLECLLPGYKRKKETEEAERQHKREMEQSRASQS